MSTCHSHLGVTQIVMLHMILWYPTTSKVVIWQMVGGVEPNHWCWWLYSKIVFCIWKLVLSKNTIEHSVTVVVSMEMKAPILCGAFNKFLDFFVQAFRIVVDSWKFTMLLLYILWDEWPIFRISASNEQLQQELEYTLLKPDCHCWWISKM